VKSYLLEIFLTFEFCTWFSGNNIATNMESDDDEMLYYHNWNELSKRNERSPSGRLRFGWLIFTHVIMILKIVSPSLQFAFIVHKLLSANCLFLSSVAPVYFLQNKFRIISVYLTFIKFHLFIKRNKLYTSIIYANFTREPAVQTTYLLTETDWLGFKKTLKNW